MFGLALLICCLIVSETHQELAKMPTSTAEALEVVRTARILTAVIAYAFLADVVIWLWRAINEETG